MQLLCYKDIQHLIFHDSRFTLAYGMLVLILCHCFCCRVLLIFTYTFATFNTCSCSLRIQATLSPSHTTVSVSVMSSKSKGVVDDAELAVLSEEQLRELAEFIDPDVSHPVSVFVTITCSFHSHSFSVTAWVQGYICFVDIIQGLLSLKALFFIAFPHM